ncbi:hypothetical protein MXB_8, partial [Myxobolus squamalis]
MLHKKTAKSSYILIHTKTFYEHDGYLYTLALPDPIAMDETFNVQDYTNKLVPIPIPSKFYRAYNFGKVALSCSDKGAFESNNHSFP